MVPTPPAHPRSRTRPPPPRGSRPASPPGCSPVALPTGPNWRSRGGWPGRGRTRRRAILDVVVARVATRPPQRGYGAWLHAPADADELLAGRLTTGRYAGTASGQLSGKVTVDIGPPGAIDFFKAAPDYPLTIRDISTMHWVNKHAEAYARTRDPKYLRAWCDTWTDFADHWDDQCAAVQNNPDIWGPGPDGNQRVLGIGWVRGTLYVSWRMQAIREGLVGVLQTATAAKQLAEVDAGAVCRLLLRLATREAPQANGLLGRADSTTPNQMRAMAMELLRAGCLWPMFTDAPTWRRRPVEVVLRTTLPDGTDREQSLNYFHNNLRELAAIVRGELAEDERDADLLGRIERASGYRDRVLPSLARPDGLLPATGSHPVWADYGRQRPLAPPSRAFTSVLFPYGGYAIQRDGWTPESRWLFMKACRPSRGHWRSQDGGLQLAAFGRTLLTSAIGDTYDARDTQAGWRLYWESSVGQNAVLVDGMAAAERRGDFTALDPWRWHSGGAIDLMETEIAGPYRGPDFRTDGRSYAARRARGEVADKAKAGPAVTDVVHRRQVHFVREAGLWIVTDRVTSRQPHDFTQTWCVGPEFAADDVVVEPAGPRRARIATVQPEGPNITLHQFSGTDLAHVRYRGIHEDDRILGWCGILADRERWIYTPAVNVHATWRSQGATVIVTLLVPHRGRESGVTLDLDVDVDADGDPKLSLDHDLETTTPAGPAATVGPAGDAEGGSRPVGFDATLAAGGRLAYRAAVAPAPLAALGVTAEAASLLVVQLPDAVTTGMALDAARFRDHPVAVADFAFTLPGGPEVVETTVPIAPPKGFEWVGTGATLAPAYQPR